MRADTTVGVVGNGVVGRAVAHGLVEHCREVRVHDLVPERSTHTLDEALDCRFVFLCLPTPDGDAGCDTSALDGVMRHHAAGLAAGRRRRPPVVVVRSTTPVGYVRKQAAALQHDNLSPLLLHSPEFLTARCSHADFHNPARNIVGVPAVWPEHRGAVDEAAALLCEFYEARWPGVPVLRMSSDSSELVKLAVNGFFAAKVTWFNLVRRLADRTGCDAGAVLRGVLSDGRIAHAHAKAPGPDGRFGYGGSCLPKDLHNLQLLSQEAGEWEVNEFLEQIRALNDHFRGDA